MCPYLAFYMGSAQSYRAFKLFSAVQREQLTRYYRSSKGLFKILH